MRGLQEPLYHPVLVPLSEPFSSSNTEPRVLPWAFQHQLRPPTHTPAFLPPPASWSWSHHLGILGGGRLEGGGQRTRDQLLLVWGGQCRLQRTGREDQAEEPAWEEPGHAHEGKSHRCKGLGRPGHPGMKV